MILPRNLVAAVAILLIVLITIGLILGPDRVGISHAQGPLQAKLLLSLHQDPADGAAGIIAQVTRVIDGAGNETATLLGSFQAQLTYDGTCINILDVRELDFSISNLIISNPTGVTTFAGSSSNGVLAPADLAQALTSLVGGNQRECAIAFDVTSLTDQAGTALDVVSQGSSISVRRGDARADGVISIADALFIAQYLVGLRAACTDTVDTTCLHSVNAASVRQDVAADQKTIADALFIAQYLVGLRDEFFNLKTSGGPVVTILSTSPADGEGGVSVTRETIIEFNEAIDPATISPLSVGAQFGEQPLSARRHLSPNGKVLTLFYDSPLPASARVRVTVDGGLVRDMAGTAVDADGDGQPGGVASIDFDTLSLTRIPGTDVWGFVYDSYTPSKPVIGATIRVDAFPEANTVTDSSGFFELKDMPAPAFFVHIDGSTATNAPTGTTYATVGKPFHSVAGQSTQLFMDGETFDIYLPPVAQSDIQALSPTADTEVSFGAAGKAELVNLFPGVDPTVWDQTMVMFPPNAAVDDFGNPATAAGIVPVPSDRLPAPLPPGVNHVLDIAVMAPGATNFEEPAPACFPNLPNPATGQPLPPGADSALVSFNHDTGEWEIGGSMTVTADGKLVCTDPGVGIRAPGWHGQSPGTTVGGGAIQLGPLPVGSAEPGPKHTPAGAPSCTACTCPPCSEEDTISDPVYLFSGEFYLTSEDLRIPGRGPDFVWSRKYRSQAGPNTAGGNAWDFSYNIRIEANGPDLTLFDGNSRGDTYLRLPDGSWGREEFFRRIIQNQNGTYTLSFPEAGEWNFNPLANSPAAGKIDSIVDRNRNRLEFGYDTNGRLDLITDTLGRDIQIRYHDGIPELAEFISEVEDFNSRVVRYEYYDGVELGGDLGDLKSVRTPTVVGTPHGNDFPNGKTTTYTYTTGFTDDRLNHNLLTITDGRRNDQNDPTFGEGPYLENTYAETTDPNDINFDRVVTQQWGHDSDIIDFVYVPLTPVEANRQAVMKTVINDRNGHVKEFFFDNRNRLITRREYTGLANPTGPTTQVNNRPAGRFRLSDPVLFETSYEWNHDSLQTRVIHPEGNITEYVYQGDVNPGAPALSRSNLLQEIQIPDLARGGDQARIVTTYTYEPIYNQVRTITEPRGNDPNYVPQNGGVRSSERYTTVHTFDYEEECDFVALGARIGRAASEVSVLLSQAGMCASPQGDINGDGRTNQINGNTVRTQYPSVRLLPGSNQAVVEGGTVQPLVHVFSYNDVDQLLSETDPEGNVTMYEYHPENDPDGDGQDLTPGVGTDPFGYLKQVTRDADSDPDRNSGTNPLPTNIRTVYQYDRVGNIIRRVDGRGIATDYVVNQLNQVVEIKRATAHAIFQPDPIEPASLTDFEYRERIFYDANDNVIHRQTEDRGNTSNVGGDNAGTGTAFVDYQYEYEILNYRIAMREEVSDSEDLITQYRYDPNRNQVLVVHPEGNAETYVFDERDLLIQRTRGAFSPPPAVQLFDGDPTNFDVRGGQPATMTYHYDQNRNLIEEVDAADTDGSLANNSRRGGAGDRTRYIYDGFDRRTSVIDSVGDQTVYQYDPAGNMVRAANFGPVQFDPVGGLGSTSDGPDSLPMPVSSGRIIQTANLVNSNPLQVTERSYDEVNRLFQTDQVLFVNTIPTLRPPDLADGADDIGKGDLTPNDNQAIPGVTGVTIVGRVTTRTEYDRNSRPTFTIEDDGDTYQIIYDGVNRTIKTVGPEGNAVETAYDDNSNVIETRETDVSQVLGVADEVFVTTHFYDSLNRLQLSVDNIGQTTDYRYDSRDNLVAMADAQGPLSGEPFSRRGFTGGALTVNAINGFGNVTRYFYDGLNRQTSQEILLTASGEGDGVNIGASIEGVKSTQVPAPDPSQGGGDGMITVGYDWDRNSLRTSLTDDNGNQTQYTYDNLNRQLSETKGLCVPPALADRCDPATTINYEYDQDDNVATVADENGSIIVSQFDAINRSTGSNVTRGVGVLGTTATSYQYDGLSRLVGASDNNEPADSSDDSVVTFAYDSLSRVIEETQQIGGLSTRAVSSSRRAENLRKNLIYPNSRTTEYTYDQRDRLNTVADQGAAQDIADYDYIGTGRVAQRHYPINGTRLTYLDDASTSDVGYDGLRRPVQLRHLRADNSLLVGFAHTYDRMNNKLDEVKLHDTANTESYDYDSVYRLTDFDRSDTGAIFPLHSDWTLDGVGNWQQVDGETRQHSSFNEIIEQSDGEVTAVLSDNNGNETDDGTFTYQWDYRNLLRTVTRKSDSALVAVYSYDASNRRIRKNVVDGPGITDFYYDVSQVIEERDGANAMTQQYVYGNYIDEPLVLDRAGLDRLFYHQNSRFSAFALTDTSGAIVEGYQYDAYGHQTVFQPGANGAVDFGGDDVVTTGGTSAVGNSYLFTGRRLDSETGLYYYRMRYMNSVQGRFISRDPLSYSDSSSNTYAYVVNSPANLSDPWGLEPFLWNTSDAIMYSGSGFIHPDIQALAKTNQALAEAKAYNEANPDWRKDLPDCPCKNPDIKRKDFNDGWASEGKAKHHPGASECFRSYPKSGKNKTYLGGPGQQCCYAQSGSLITSGPGAGTPDRVGTAKGERTGIRLEFSLPQPLGWKNGHISFQAGAMIPSGTPLGGNVKEHIQNDVGPSAILPVEIYNIYWPPNQGQQGLTQ